MFIAGVSKITEPPFNDVWTVAGEEHLREHWRKEDADFFAAIDPIIHYHTAQIRDFLQAILEDRPPLITGEDGRRTVEFFTAIYRTQRDRAPVRFPLPVEN
jgi:predicted dehydrogenase